VPAAGAWPSGCPFHPRCARAALGAESGCCTDERPRLLGAPRPPGEGVVAPSPPALRAPDVSLELERHRVACHFPGEEPR
jgi:hypothetical protein